MLEPYIMDSLSIVVKEYLQYDVIHSNPSLIQTSTTGSCKHENLTSISSQCYNMFYEFI